MVIMNSATARLSARRRRSLFSRVKGTDIMQLSPKRYLTLRGRQNIRFTNSAPAILSLARSTRQDSRRRKRTRLPGRVWSHSILCWVENSNPGRPAHRLLQKQRVYSDKRLISTQMVALNKIRHGGVGIAWVKCEQGTGEKKPPVKWR